MSSPLTVGQTARALLAAGFSPVLVRAGMKRAVHDAWPSLVYDETSIGEFDGHSASVGLLWGRGHIDVDLETPMTALMGAALLPPTSLRWGRPGLDNSHAVYAVESGAKKVTKYPDHEGTKAAEIRYHSLMSVVPPSRYPESEGSYAWSSDVVGHGVSPATDAEPGSLEYALSWVGRMTVEALESAVKETVFAAAMADMWPRISGNRHDTMLGMCGMLMKSGRTAERVEEIAGLVVRYGQDPDPEDRLKIPGLTAARLAEGQEVSGFRLIEQTLGEGFAKWMGRLFHLPVERVSEAGGVTLNDLGNAELFCRLFGEDLLYLGIKKAWSAWDGSRWKDETGTLLEQAYAKRTVRHLETMAGDLGTASERAAMRQHALRSGDANAVTAMVKLSRDALSVDARILDADPWLYNVRNGTLDLRDGTLREARREDRITRVAGVEWDEGAECPGWMRFLRETFLGREELVEFVQRMAGYTLTGNTREQCLFFFYGHGKNGKTTLIEVLAAIHEGYGIRTPSETLIRQRQGQGIPNDVARLKGARFIASKEVDAGTLLAENVVKDLTGGDTITARFLHGEWFDFRPEGKLVMYGNHKPVVKGQDEGIWRRIKLVPFEHQVVDGIDDLAAKLVDAEGSGILRWMVEGCMKWQVGGLQTPEVVSQATEEYRSEMDVLGEFVSRYYEMTRRVSDKVEMSELYYTYMNWCSSSGERMMTQRAVNGKLVERGFDKIKSNGKWYLSGMRNLRHS